jgi:hypothetical protein
VSEKAVQEWAADLRRQTFEKTKKPNGFVIKTYNLSRTSILNIVGVLKLVLGRRVWMSWEELTLGSRNTPGPAEAVDWPQLGQNRRPIQPHA